MKPRLTNGPIVRQSQLTAPGAAAGKWISTPREHEASDGPDGPYDDRSDSRDEVDADSRQTVKFIKANRKEQRGNRRQGNTMQGEARTKKLKVNIDRGMWLRGATKSSRLKSERTGHQCCMGMACSADGVTADLDEQCYIEAMQMEGDELAAHHHAIQLFASPQRNPEDRVTDPRLPASSHKGFGHHRNETHIVDLLYALNDDQSLDDATRERYLSDAGRTADIEFVFSGEALPRHIEEEYIHAAASQESDPKAAVAAYSWLDTNSRRWVDDPNGRQQVDRHSQTGKNRSCYDLLQTYADHHSELACRVKLYDRDNQLLMDRYTEPHA